MKDVLCENFIRFGVSIADKYFIFYGLIHKNEINFYLSVFRAKISLNEEIVNEIKDFIHILLIL